MKRGILFVGLAGVAGTIVAIGCSPTTAVRFDGTDAAVEDAETSAPWQDDFQPSTSYWEAGADADGDASTSALEGPVRVFAFGSTTCALVPGNVLKCWGRNAYGLVGNGDAEETDVVAPTVVNGVSPTLVAGGANHVCVSDGASVRCWGRDTYGALGLGSGSTTSTCKDGAPCNLAPSAVTMGSSSGDIVSLGSGGDFSCAALSNGTVECWGRNDLGQLGSTTSSTCNGVACSHTPIVVPGVSNAVKVAVGGTSACARTSTGDVTCWGRLYDFDAYSVHQTSPILPPTLLDTAATLDVAAGTAHACVVYGTSGVGCIGSNFTAQSAPVASYALAMLTPRAPAQSPYGFRRLALGGGHSCGITKSNVVYCWGDARDNQVLANCGVSSAAVAASALIDATDVSAGDFHTCVAQVTGTVTCFGRNDHGQLGGEIAGPFDCYDAARAGHIYRQVTGLQ